MKQDKRQYKKQDRETGENTVHKNGTEKKDRETKQGDKTRRQDKETRRQDRESEKEQ